MSSPDTLQFQWHCRDVDWRELEALFRKTGLGGARGRQGAPGVRAEERVLLRVMALIDPARLFDRT